MPRSKSRRSAPSALESEQRELAAREGQLQAQIAALQQTLSEAPKIAAENARLERESIINASRGYYRHRTLTDTRHTAEAARTRRKPQAAMLRSERSAARRQALALLVLLGAALAWAITHFWP